MDTGLNFFSNWAKNQGEILETTLKSQEVFRSHWLESMKKTQESFLATVSSYDNPQSKEAANLFSKWFDYVIGSTEVFNDQVTKLQHIWQNTLRTQLEQSQALTNDFVDYLKKSQSKATDKL